MLTSCLATRTCRHGNANKRAAHLGRPAIPGAISTGLLSIVSSGVIPYLQNFLFDLVRNPPPQTQNPKKMAHTLGREIAKKSCLVIGQMVCSLDEFSSVLTLIIRFLQTLASRKRCDLKTRKRCDFYPAAQKIASDFSAISSAIFWRFVCEFCGKTCDLVLCDLKTQRFFCDCDFLGR